MDAEYYARVWDVLDNHDRVELYGLAEHYAEPSQSLWDDLNGAIVRLASAGERHGGLPVAFRASWRRSEMDDGDRIVFRTLVEWVRLQQRLDHAV